MGVKVQFVIGLGNPGDKYRNTPHNLGRVLVEQLAESQKLSWNEEGSFLKTKSEPSFVILKTFMNASGEAVVDLLQRYDCPPEEILICYDDFDIPFGSIRIRKKGSAGSHNGLKSVTERLAAENFPRLRLGIGPVHPGIPPDEFVLQPFSKSQVKPVQAMLTKASQAVETILKKGIEKAMNQFNAKSEA